jgi:hypothetical protein
MKPIAHLSPQAAIVHPTATSKAFADLGSTAKIVDLAKTPVSGSRMANATPRTDIIGSEA